MVKDYLGFAEDEGVCSHWLDHNLGNLLLLHYQNSSTLKG